MKHKVINNDDKGTGSYCLIPRKKRLIVAEKLYTWKIDGHLNTLHKNRLVACLLLAVLLGCQEQPSSAAGKRVVVLGFDGMDHRMTQSLIEAGKLPNLARLAQQGFGGPLETSVPPLSPVAWSEFITGLDAGGHGIFDFIHRDPTTMQPYLSTSKIESSVPALLPERISIGDCVLPLSKQVQTNLRHGEPFWSRLEAQGIQTWIMRMPANYPPSGTAFRELSGMGTPDLLGSYGTFSFYGTGLFVLRKSVDGGEIYPVEFEQNRVVAKLYGPINPFVAEATQTSVDFSLEIGPHPSLALLHIGDQVVQLQTGQWSPWIAIDFELDCIPFMSVPGIVRFYPRQLQPELELYVSPINIDPVAPVQPISTPAKFAAQLAAATGRFYTQGMMEDTKALSEGVLTRAEFLAQAALAGLEVERQYYPLLDEFKVGLLFYYFGNLDQVSHMMYRHLDSANTGKDPQADSQFADVIPNLYQAADRIVGETLDQLGPDDLLIVMSDHGFAPWQRSFNLNSWLRDQGYLVLKDQNLAADPGQFLNVDWSQTRAYGLGFNGLYINQQGRERDGIVPVQRVGSLLAEIADQLKNVIDPATGLPAVTRTYIAREYFRDKEHLDVGPDLIVGYARGTRNHSDSAIGTLSTAVFSDNLGEWSGDHAMDHTAVPGVLFASRPLARPANSLRELSASILAEFGLD